MKRLAEQFLKDWAKGPQPKPLLLRGARQVGKSTLVTNFARENGLKLVSMNLEILKIKSLESNPGAIDQALKEIRVKTNLPVDENDPSTLLFFDEIQESPEILTSLRYFYENKPGLKVISAGSLLEFALKAPNFSMPVGRIQYLHLGPMTFFEFLEALGENALLTAIIEDPHQDFLFETAVHKMREYFFVGGMPEAVKVYATSKDPRSVRTVHSSILQTYRDDFPKYSTRAQVPRVEKIFERLPQAIGKKIKYSQLMPEEKSREVKKALDLLFDARVALRCVHTNATGLPLKSLSDERILKPYFLDIGLLSASFGIEWSELMGLSQTELVVKGVLAEQFVAQHLNLRSSADSAPELFYWLRDKNSARAEIDFVLAFEGHIYPVEVKAGETGTLKSLKLFCEETKNGHAVRLDLKKRLKNEKLGDATLWNHPLFAIEILLKNSLKNRISFS